MTVTSIAAESSSTRCAICARSVRRGAKLCSQCKAAVKRARDVPSIHSEFLPHAIAGTAAAGVRGGGHSRSPPARRPNGVRLPAVPGGWGTYATLIAFGAAVCITGYFVMGEREDESRRESGIPATHATPVADTNGDGATRAQPPETAHTAADRAPTNDVNALIERILQPASLPPSQRGLPSRNPGRDARSAGDGSAATASDARNLDGESRSVNAATGDNVVALPAVPVTQTHEPSTPDRWQMLAAAVSRCERENVLAGFVCKERARLQYCDGHWGEAPQCPGGGASNNTR